MKRGSIPPTFVFPAIAVGLLALAFLYYYFPARIRREDALNQQAFRQLGTIADLVQNAVSNYGTVLERWARANTGKDLEGFSGQVPDLHYVPAPADTPDTLQIGTRSQPRGVLLWFQYGRHGADIPIETVVTRYIGRDAEETFDEFLIADGSGNVLFQTRRTGLHIRDLSTLPGALQPAGADGKSEGKPGGSKSAAAAQRASDVVKISLGGTDYRLYSSPAPIRVRRPDTTPALDLVLYGLISESNVRTRALVTPGSVQITVGLMVALVICVAWPLLKFRTMRASERVPRGAGLYFFITSIVTIVLLMVLMSHLWYLVADFDHTEAKLDRLAEAIDHNVTHEAHQALDALNQAMESAWFNDAAAKLQPNKAACGIDTPYVVQQQAGDVLTWRDFPVAGYPYFDQMFWGDDKGFQQIKWTVRSHVTPATRLCQYPFFGETLEGHLWYFADGGISQSRFRIDPLYSPNTGEYQAVISQPYVQRPDQPQRPLAVSVMVTQMVSLIHPVVPPDYGFAIVDESGTVLFHSIAARNGREQLFDEVQNDPAVRAAVFARTGGHLITTYHGAPHRFFVRPLRRIQGCPWTLVTFRDLRPMSAVQMERTVLFLILSIGYLVLVGVFAATFIRLKEYPLKWLWPQDGLNAYYLHTALSLTALAALLYLVVIRAPLPVAFVTAISAPVVGIRIISWKLQGRELRIRALGVVLLVLVTGALALAILFLRDLRWWQAGPLLLGACLAIQFCASRQVTNWIAKSGSTGAARRLPEFTSSYTVMALSLLLLVPSLPCVSFFRIAYDFHESMFTRQAQLQTMASLEDRVERVRQSYSKVALTDIGKKDARLADPSGKINDVIRAQFLRQRIDDVRFDRYDDVFVAGVGQEYSPRPPGSTSHGFTTRAGESRFWQPLQFLASLSRDPYTSGARFLNGTRHDSTQWSWTPEGDRHLRLRPRFVPASENASTESPPTAALARLVVSNPVLLSEDLVSEIEVLEPGLWEMAIPLILIGGLMYLLFRSTIGRIFVLHVSFEPPWPETNLDAAVTDSHNLILVGLPRTGKTVTLDLLRRAGKIYYIDLAELVPKVLAAEGKQVRVQRNQFTEPVIVLDHFEFNCQDPEVNRVKLEILEWLAHEPNKRVLVVTAIDPVFYLHPGPLDDAGSPEGFAPGKYLDRWMAALAGFDIRRLPPPTAQRNGYYYQLLWAACSRSERVALYQLARDGWPNHQNWRALDHLLKRGLIECTPVFRIVDPGFRDYIRTVVGQRDVTIWELGESITVWDGVRIAFYILAVGVVVAVSIYHQQQVLALITTLLGVVPALGKFFKDSIGRSAEKPAKGGSE